MPTGYTSTLHDGDQTFHDFAMDCARAFGALIEMRDAPRDAEIPDRFEPWTEYHDERIEKATSLLAELDAMPPVEAQRRADAEYEESASRVAEAYSKADAIRGRYEAMRMEVEAWDPPTANHVEMKRFMLDQLARSIKSDCSTGWLKTPEPKTGTEWVEAQRETALHDLDRYTGERAKEVARAEGRTAWLKALRESLRVSA